MFSFKSKQMKCDQVGVVQHVLFVFLLVVLACIALVSPFSTYYARGLYRLNYMYLILGLILGFGFTNLNDRLISHSFIRNLLNIKSKYMILAALSLILLVVQGIVVAHAWFKTGWDVRWVTSANQGLNIYDSNYLTYVSRYPNQMFLESLNYLISRACSFVGIHDSYLVLIGINVCEVNLTCLITAMCSDKILGLRYMFPTWVFMATLIGLSPWILIPYSDCLGMFISSLFLLLYVSNAHSRIVWLLIGLLTPVAAAIKPTLIAFIGAIILTKFFQKMMQIIDKRKTRGNKPSEINIKEKVTHFILVILFVVGLAAGKVTVAVTTSLFPIQPDGCSQLSAAHFLMMGHNEQTLGGYSDEDIAYSESFPIPAERVAGDLNEFAHRVQKMGPIRLGKLYFKKLCSTFADGTFSWKQEGSFFVETPHEGSYLSQVYGIGTTETPFAPISQLIWFCVLIGCTLSCRIPTSRDSVIRILCISILSLGLFLMFFECRARYLIQFLPYFVVLAVAGWGHIAHSKDITYFGNS